MWIDRTLEGLLPCFKDKLIVISGPRQCGKTSLVNRVFRPSLVLNMDLGEDRLKFRKLDLLLSDKFHKSKGEKPAVFVDEIHKAKGWRNQIKGVFDKWHHACQFVVSGSSAFELRKQDQGDSLAGRAAWLELGPVSFREYFAASDPSLNLPLPWDKKKSCVDCLYGFLSFKSQVEKLWPLYCRFGSFPENLHKQNELAFTQWLTDYVNALLDRDLKDLNSTKDGERVYHLFLLLLEGLGSTYSLRSLAETLQVAPDTIKSDIRALRQVLWGFELGPYASSLPRQIRKEKKFYPSDFCFLRYAEPASEGAFLETVVASKLNSHLRVTTNNPFGQIRFSFFRDYFGHEVDFILSRKKEVFLAIECKKNPKKEIGQKIFLTQKLKPKETIMIVEEPAYFERRKDYTVIGAGFFLLALG